MVYKETLSNGYGDRMGIERVIFDAMFCRRFKYLLKLLESGFNPDVVDDNKMSLLTHACLFDNAEERMYLVKLLIEYGAVPKRRDRFNMDSLMHATLAGHSDVIPLLIEESIDDIHLNTLSSEGYPLLSMAVISGNFTCVQQIYDIHKKFGIHVDDVANDKNVTPYMEAKRRGQQLIAQFLADVGRASPLRVDSDGKSVNELTREFHKNQEEMIQHRFNERMLINPPRFSKLHPELSVRLEKSKDRALSKSVSFMTSRENTEAPGSNPLTRSLRWHSATFKMPRHCDVIPNKNFPAHLKSKVENEKTDKVDPENRLSNGQGIKTQLAEFYNRKSDAMGAFFVPSFETAHVSLDSREEALLRRAERKVRRKQNKTAAATQHHMGYNYPIPEALRLQFSQQKEKSFTLRRASEANLDKVEITN